MIDTQVRCDVCKEIRGPSNHWLLVFETDGIRFKPWDDDEASFARHACGASCAHKILDRYLESLRNGESNG